MTTRTTLLPPWLQISYLVWLCLFFALTPWLGDDTRAQRETWLLIWLVGFGAMFVARWTWTRARK